MLLRKAPSQVEVYNDLDGELVNLFRVLRDQGSRLVEALKLTPFSRDEFENSYRPSDDPVEQARRTIVRSRFGFGTSAHLRKTGFRLKYGRGPADWRSFGDGSAELVDRLRGVVIENRPALDIIDAFDGRETLFYVDPPYVPETRDKGSDYRFEMSVDDHRRLAERLKSVQGSVIVSGYPSGLYEDLFSGWQRVETRSLADGARPRNEVLWMRLRATRAPTLFDLESRG